MKKLVSIVLALALVLASCAVAFAADPITIVVEDTNEHIIINGRTYTAWKLFDAVYSADGKNAAYTMSTSSYFYTTSATKTILEKYFKFTEIAGDTTKVTVEKLGTWTDARALANEMQPYLGNAVPSGLKFTSPEAANEKATITVDGPGYYLITGDAKSAADETKIVTAAVGAISVKDTVTIHPKADAPSLDKKATGDVVLDAKGEQAIAQVGTDVDFEIDTFVPDTTGYDKYTFIIHDSMTSGLTFKSGSLAVTINGSEYTGGTFVGPTATSNTFSYTIPMADLTPAGAPIVLTYKATVNDGALTTDFERNTANLEYSNNPYKDETHHTPDEHVWVIDLNIDVDKIDGESKAKLEGAKFKLYRNDGTGDTDWYSWDATAKKVVWTTFANAQESTTDSEGKLDTQFRGLTVGTYHLRETKAPDGYNGLTTDPEIVITADDDDATHATIKANGKEITNGTVELTTGDHTAKQPVAVEEVTNNKGAVLPSTGGIGTTIFYILGGLLVIGAAVILVARRKAQD